MFRLKLNGDPTFVIILFGKPQLYIVLHVKLKRYEKYWEADQSQFSFFFLLPLTVLFLKTCAEKDAPG